MKAYRVKENRQELDGPCFMRVQFFTQTRRFCFKVLEPGITLDYYEIFKIISVEAVCRAHVPSEVGVRERTHMYSLSPEQCAWCAVGPQ